MGAAAVAGAGGGGAAAVVGGAAVVGAAVVAAAAAVVTFCLCSFTSIAPGTVYNIHGDVWFVSIQHYSLPCI